MQAADDYQLLELMLDDTQHAPEIYRPTNYWAAIIKHMLPELKKMGLKDFRRRHGSFLESFGAVDLAPTLSRIDLSKSSLFNNSLLRRVPLWHHVLSSMSSLLNKTLPLSNPPYNFTIKEVELLSYEFTRTYGKNVGAKSLDLLNASLVGNPEDIITVGENTYTSLILYYYLRYAYCCKFLNFDNVKVIVELGSGAGKQVEVLKKLHPDISYVLFDLPPQLYVCERYLSTVFPDSVVSYRSLRTLKTILKLEKGKIYFFGNWQFPLLDKTRYDLFWNAASLSEMEPDVVANYLRYVNSQADAVYLMQCMKGKNLARKKGKCGVLRQTTINDYERGLANFQPIDFSPCLNPIGTLKEYSDSFWNRKLRN